jgi:hypothetical protein
MHPIDASFADSGRGSYTWGPIPGQTSAWTAAALADCRVTFAHSPINTISATTVAEVAELVDLIERDVD